MDNSKKHPAPKHLKGEGLLLWECYTEELAGRNMLHEADYSALARLCILEAEAGKLAQQIAKEGVIRVDKNGDERRSPALMALANTSQIIEAMKKSLALGAFYRHRIGEQPQEEKPVSALMAMRKKPNTYGNQHAR